MDEYRDQILKLMEQNLSGVRIFEELQACGVQISYSAVKRYIAAIKKNEDVHIRFHTKPGEEAQVDFGYVGLTPDSSGKRRRTWVFNMRLSYSRLDYYECVFDQKVETFIQCHLNAFKFFKGIPEHIKIDNLKAAILEANFYEPVYQRLYKQFADYSGFLPMPCRVRQPQEKGKVESGIKYIKGNFFAGRQFASKTELEAKLTLWINKVNSRVHGTTRQKPQELFAKEESKCLKALPSEEYCIPSVGTRMVYHDCHVYIAYNYYSVPYEYIGKEVDIEVTSNLVKISYNGKQIAVHGKSLGRGEFITAESHYPKYKNILATENQDRILAKMQKLGTSAAQLFIQLLDKQSGHWYRTATGILSLTKEYTPEVVELACARALAYGVYSYNGIKNICKQGAYLLPIDYELGGIQ